MSLIKKLLFTFIFLIPAMAFAQTGNVKGILKDELNQPINKAKVIVQGTSIETQSDSTGSYELNNVPYGTHTIEVTDGNATLLTEAIVVDQPSMEKSFVVVTNPITETNDLPTISLADDEIRESASSNVSSVLSAGRDPFNSASSFVFSIARFRVRGYDSDNAPGYMNGAVVTDLANGRVEYNIWSGLNDVVRSRDNSLGLSPSNFAFGGIGGGSSIDSRASKQRKQFSVSYASSNRVYDNRLVVTYGSGVSSKGWSYSLSGSRRWAEEGYIAGTFYDGTSFFGSLEKSINKFHSLSLTAFGAQTKSGRSTAVVQEMYDLAGSNYYNPLWGYHDGKKRNAAVGNNFQPIGILSHEWKFNEKSSLETAVTYQSGKNSISGIDWFNAADPRPDYYRYLPSFDPAYGDNPDAFAKDSTMLANLLSTNESMRQINWNKIYEANQLHDTAKYIISNRVTDADRFSFNSTFNSEINDNLSFTAGLSYQKQDLNYYKEVEDLLGGKYFVNLNQFADQTSIEDSSIVQNDLNNPNARIVEGDRYGYDYVAHLQKASVWAQGVWKYTKVDFFLAGQLTMDNFYREGNVRNGVFADDSYGNSEKQSFTNPAFKGGVTYKLDGRNYFYVNGAYINRAPLFENTYVSPRTRALAVKDIKNEKITSVEGGYLYRAPRVKARATAYLTQFEDLTDTRSFYHGDFKTFVNYTLTGISKSHTGLELAVDAQLGKGFSAAAVASIGQFIYTDRMNATITQDNRDTLLAENEVVYSENLRASGGPQSAYTLGLTYRSKQYWTVNVNFNYFDNIYTDFNPARRTLSALDLVDSDSPKFAQILGQEKRDGQFTMDVSAYYSWKLNNRYKSLKKNTFLVFNLGVTNILDNQELTSWSFEQLRFDNEEHDVNTFPAKYAYSFGASYFASITLRFN
jgi:hypothetical protein